MVEKGRIRKTVLSKRDSLDPGLRKEKDLLIKENLLSLPEFRQAKTLFLFASFRSEVSTLPIMEEALKLGKRIVLPRVDTEKKELRLYEILSISEVSPGFMGIPEPDASPERERQIDAVDLAVMPGAAFDIAGNRIGYGGGYYDRLLSRLNRTIPLVAVAYEEQMVESVATEPHDIRVHLIVTDERVIDCRNLSPSS